MLGWRRVAALASTWKRASPSATADLKGLLMATRRPRFSSWARITSPMPPRPRTLIISYRPIFPDATLSIILAHRFMARQAKKRLPKLAHEFQGAEGGNYLTKLP